MDEYHTSTGQRSRMYNSLVVGFVSFFSLGFITWIKLRLSPETPQDFMTIILAGGTLIGFYGFFSHRNYMRQLLLLEGKTIRKFWPGRWSSTTRDVTTTALEHKEFLVWYYRPKGFWGYFFKTAYPIRLEEVERDLKMISEVSPLGAHGIVTYFLMLHEGVLKPPGIYSRFRTPILEAANNLKVTFGHGMFNC